MEGVMQDPNTVLSITAGLGNLNVASVPTSSEPSTPLGASGNESPLSLDAGLRDWLTEALIANAASNPKVYVKLLVSNAASGSIIGKGGGNINDVQAKTFARIQLSKANEYFPGTTERTLLVTGRLKQVVAALGLLFAKLLREGVAPLSPKSKAAAAFPPPGSEGEDAADRPLRLLVRLLVPQPLCGVIIGKNGVTIRNYAADTGTIIRVTSNEAAQVPSSHRIVTIAGEKEGVLKAIALMTLKQSDDPKFPLYGELPSPTMARGDGGFSSGGATLPPSFLPHPGTPFLPPSPALYSSPGGSHGMFPMLPPSMNGSTAPALAADGFSGGSSVALLLSEDQAALLLGDGSRVVVEVEQMTGCRMRLDMADGPRGPYGRLLLSGSPEVVAYAQWLLGQRLAAAAASYQFSGTTYYAPTPGFVAPPLGAMAYWPTAGMMLPPQTAQQQQHMMAAAAALPQPVALRQHSGSSVDTL
ncbi:hypothetical protein ABPG77_003094 [Micractinium sp. CCAP 211/92]